MQALTRELNRACRARYRGINTDRSKVQQFRRAEADTGSSEVQIAQISARVTQLTTHLQEHKKVGPGCVNDQSARCCRLSATATSVQLAQP